MPVRLISELLRKAAISQRRAHESLEGLFEDEPLKSNKRAHHTWKLLHTNDPHGHLETRAISAILMGHVKKGEVETIRAVLERHQPRLTEKGLRYSLSTSKTGPKASPLIILSLGLSLEREEGQLVFTPQNTFGLRFKQPRPDENLLREINLAAKQWASTTKPKG